MNPMLTNSYSFSVEKSFKQNKLNSSNQLPAINNFFFSNTIATNHRTHNHSRHKRTKSVRYSYTSTQPSFNIRKDIYGNKIEKGGNHKISFKDNLKGKKLVETTLIDLKKNVIKNKKVHHKIDKKDFIIKETTDKEEIICSSACNIF